MDYALILDNIARHISLSDEEQQFFINILVPRNIRRKQYLLKDGEVCKYTAFVTNGCLRGYTVDGNGFEHILQFAPADWWIADMYSLITQAPGQLNIDALEDTEVLLLPKVMQEELFATIPKFERFFRIITEKSLVTNRQRILDGMSLTAAQRYAQFCQRYPSLIHTLPQKQVAAYIGVTPEFLSKLRSDFIKRA